MPAQTAVEVEHKRWSKCNTLFLEENKKGWRELFGQEKFFVVRSASLRWGFARKTPRCGPKRGNFSLVDFVVDRAGRGCSAVRAGSSEGLTLVEPLWFQPREGHNVVEEGGSACDVPEDGRDDDELSSLMFRGEQRTARADGG